MSHCASLAAWPAWSHLGDSRTPKRDVDISQDENGKSGAVAFPSQKISITFIDTIVLHERPWHRI